MWPSNILEYSAAALAIALVIVLLVSWAARARRAKANLVVGYEQRLGKTRTAKYELTGLDEFLIAIAPLSIQESLQTRLMCCGKQGNVFVASILKQKAALLLSGLILSIAALGIYAPAALPIFILAIALFFLPDLQLANKAKARREQIGNLLPDALDQLTLLVDSGLDFQTAFVRVCKNSSGFLNDEFQRTLADLQLGYTRKDAFENLGERTGSPVLKNFARAMVLADLFGVPVSNVLRSQAQDLRHARRARAEEEAQKVPTKITFPLVLCLLPVILILLVAPSVIRLMSSL